MTVEFNGKIVSVGVFPIGIDLERVERLRIKPSVREKMESIRDHYAGKKIIFGRDKLDHAKSVTHLLNAYEQFLTGIYALLT
jgi:trehalose-6-phosphate synthase